MTQQATRTPGTLLEAMLALVAVDEAECAFNAGDAWRGPGDTRDIELSHATCDARADLCAAFARQGIDWELVNKIGGLL